VSSRNRDKRVQNRESRLTAAQQATRRARMRRWEVAAGGVVLALIVGIAFAIHNNGKNKAASATTTTTASSTTTTTVKPLPSAAGKPCVAVSSPLPNGAPTVPVVVGPPPKTLLKKDLKVGTGALVKATSTIKVNYVGVACSTGKIFDSSYQDGGPASFPLSGVIPGWQQGIPGMRVGGERLLGIPSALAYGTGGSAPLIAPNEPLWFVVEVLSAS
jgi:peptidylprolyl isomerase